MAEIEHIGSSISVFRTFVRCICRICGHSGPIAIPYGTNGYEMYSCEDHVDNVADLAEKAKNYAEFDHIFYDRNNTTYRIRLPGPEHEISDSFSPRHPFN
jgi:hypothetical protein